MAPLVCTQVLYEHGEAIYNGEMAERSKAPD